MLRLALMPLVLFAFAACSSESVNPVPFPPVAPPQAIDFASGSRLRARYERFEDARTFVGFFDTEQGTDCRFEETSEGWRCLPHFDPALQVVYRDPECTSPLLVSINPVDPETLPLLVVEHNPFGCEAPTAWAGPPFDRGPEIPVPAQVYERSPSGLCSPSGGYALAFEATPATFEPFVGAEAVPSASVDGLSTVMLLGEDGSKLALRVHDEALNEDCVNLIAGAAFDEAACLSSHVAVVEEAFSASETCNAPTRLALTSSCNAPNIVWEPRSWVDCEDPLPTLYALGDAAAFYDGTPDGCTRLDELPHARFQAFEIGARLPSSAVPSVALRPFGAGRLVRYEAVTSSGVRLAIKVGPRQPTRSSLSSGWFDTALSTTCVTARADMGVASLCLPEVVHAMEELDWLYADPACSEPVLGAACGEPDVVTLLDNSLDTQPPVGTARLGEEVEELFSMVDGACTPSQGSTSDQPLIFRRVLDVTGLDVLASVERVEE